MTPTLQVLRDAAEAARSTTRALGIVVTITLEPHGVTVGARAGKDVNLVLAEITVPWSAIEQATPAREVLTHAILRVIGQIQEPGAEEHADASSD